MPGRTWWRFVVELLETLFGNLLKSPLKLRNQVADSFFYDVDALDLAEREMLSPLVDLKGTIIVVSPRDACYVMKVAEATREVAMREASFAGGDHGGEFPSGSGPRKDQEPRLSRRTVWHLLVDGRSPLPRQVPRQGARGF